MRRVATMFLLVLVTVGLTVGCGDGEEDSGGGTVSIGGTWTSSYVCVPTVGDPFSGEDTLVITQSGNRVNFTVSDGATGTGTVSGSTVTWNSTGPNYTEAGTWTIRDADSMDKSSTYTNSPSVGGGGECTGTLEKTA